MANNLTHISTLADFTGPELITPSLKSSTAEDVISELSAMLQQLGQLDDSPGFCARVLAREQMSPTAVPPGWALPHARLAGLPRLSFALGRTSRPLTWFGATRERVRVVFLFAVPESESKAYLDMVSAVARLNRDGSLSEQLLRASDAPALFGILQQAPLRPLGAVRGTSVAEARLAGSNLRF